MLLADLKKIESPGGSVFHAMKSSDASYEGFGEAYFSLVDFMSIRAWKRHRTVTCNLVVPVGEVLFVVCAPDTKLNNINFQEVVLSPRNYQRLTIKPKSWFGFQGLNPTQNIILNVADFEHDPNEVDRLAQDEIIYKWRSEF